MPRRHVARTQTRRAPLKLLPLAERRRCRKKDRAEAAELASDLLECVLVVHSAFRTAGLAKQERVVLDAYERVLQRLALFDDERDERSGVSSALLEGRSSEVEAHLDALPGPWETMTRKPFFSKKATAPSPPPRAKTPPVVDPILPPRPSKRRGLSVGLELKIMDDLEGPIIAAGLS